MKILLIFLLICLSSCATQQKGHYIVDYDGVKHNAISINVTDEENKITYKGSDGKTYTYKGSFEVYED